MEKRTDRKINSYSTRHAVEHSKKEGEIIVLLEKNNKTIILEVKTKGLPIKKAKKKIFLKDFIVLINQEIEIITTMD